ncbi:hypothetical protein LOZ80_25620 [Paenibacillus sp. HWE-109]|uniref:hypothetical protein n=1 Tax=Paenibacillus sp. HWE-109 TaxID=1306526 RepID=UPI001EDFDE64|nr:hypothetical protein [Paenibacillus sp. HWE-109]UKS24962.1 hypothetical protein LOZ80_25620 [Paenibacillus sp. HWE-109]
MHRKTRNWLKQVKELGLIHQVTNQWLSGPELIEQRQLFMQKKAHSIPRSSVISLHAWKRHLPSAKQEPDLWTSRKQLILQLAERRNGKIRLLDVAAECNVNIRIAGKWLKQLAMEGTLSFVAGHRSTMVYAIKDVRPEKE